MSLQPRRAPHSLNHRGEMLPPNDVGGAQRSPRLDVHKFLVILNVQVDDLGRSDAVPELRDLHRREVPEEDSAGAP